jgi:hypothetical protein
MIRRRANTLARLLSDRLYFKFSVTGRGGSMITGVADVPITVRVKDSPARGIEDWRERGVILKAMSPDIDRDTQVIMPLALFEKLLGSHIEQNRDRYIKEGK